MKKLLILSIAVILAISTVIAGCAAPPPAEPAPPEEVPEVEVFNWDMQILLPAGDPSLITLERFSDNVRKASNGRLNIKVHPAGALVGVFEMFDTVSEGVFEMFFANPIYWSGKDPAFAALSDHPVTFTDAWQIEGWYWQGGGVELARELYADYNLYTIPIVVINAGSLDSKVKISTLEDFEGLKVRAPQGMMADVLTKAGAAVTVVSGGDVYNALEKGVVDAAQFGPPSMHYTFGWNEVTDYTLYPWPTFQATGAEISINMDAWNSLPEDLQAILESECLRFSRDLYQYLSIRDYEALKKIVEYGNEWIQLPDEETDKLRALSLEVIDEWAEKSPKAGEILTSKKAYMKRIGIIE